MTIRRVWAVCILVGVVALIWAWLPSAGWLYASAILAVGTCLALVAWAGESLPLSARRAVVIGGLTVSVIAIIGTAAASLPALAVVPFIAAIGGYVELWRRGTDRRTTKLAESRMVDGMQTEPRGSGMGS